MAKTQLAPEVDEEATRLAEIRGFKSGLYMASRMMGDAVDTFPIEGRAALRRLSRKVWHRSTCSRKSVKLGRK